MLIGCNYEGQRNDLKGCVNDMLQIREMLVDRFSYEDSQIVLLSDGDAEVYKPAGNMEKPSCWKGLPRIGAVRTALRDIVRRANEGSVNEVFIGYSGHGTRREDFNGDEGEETKLGRGHDEYIVLLNEPESRSSSHLLSDDELHEELTKLPSGCRVVIAVDACHSGSVCDLQYSYSPQTEQWRDRGYNKGMDAYVVKLASCYDEQLSITKVFQTRVTEDDASGGRSSTRFINTGQGAFTKFFTQAVRAGMELDGGSTVRQLAHRIENYEARKYATGMLRLKKLRQEGRAGQMCMASVSAPVLLDAPLFGLPMSPDVPP